MSNLFLLFKLKLFNWHKLVKKKKTTRRDVFRTVQPFYTIIMPQTKSLTKEILLSCNQNSFVTSVNKQCSPKVCFGEVFHIKCIIIKWSHMQITGCWKHFTFTKKRKNQEMKQSYSVFLFVCLFHYILYYLRSCSQWPDTSRPVHMYLSSIYP